MLAAVKQTFRVLKYARIYCVTLHCKAQGLEAKEVKVHNGFEAHGMIFEQYDFEAILCLSNKHTDFIFTSLNKTISY